MSIYLSFFTNKNYFPSLSEFEPYLPFDDSFYKETYQYKKDNNCLYIWSWDAIFDRKIQQYKDGFIFIQGYGDTKGAKVEQQFLDIINKKKNDVFGSFCGVYHGSKKIIIYTSIASTIHMYMYKTDQFIAFSNNIGVLSCLGKLSIRKIALGWLCGFSHLLDNGTIFNEIERIPPGSRSEVFGVNEIKFYRNYSYFFTPRGLKEISEDIDCFIENIYYQLKNINLDIILKLSGGKDSRALFALFDYLGILYKKNFSLSTTGHLHNPEVRAVQEIMDMYPNLKNKHTICKTYIYKQNDLILSVINSAFSGACLRSFADRSIYNYSPKILSIGGQQNGMKDIANKMSLDEYINNSIYISKFNVYNLVNKDYAIFLKNKYKQSLEYECINLPVNKYKIIEHWLFKNPNFEGYTNSTAMPAANNFWPLVDIFFLKIMFSGPDELTSLQAIYYLLMRKANQPIWSVPFLQDTWPPELSTYLTKLGLPTYGLQNKPYMHSYFSPETKSFGLFQYRLELFDLTKSFIIDSITNNKVFDFINKIQVIKFFKKNSDQLSFSELYTALSLLSATLIAEFGQDILVRTNKKYLYDELSARFNFKINKKISIENILQHKLEKYDEALSLSLKYIDTLENTRGLNLTLDSTIKLFGNLIPGKKNYIKGDIEFVSKEDYNACLFCFNFLPMIKKQKAIFSKSLKMYYTYINTLENHINLEIIVPKNISNPKIGIRLWNNKNRISIYNLHTTYTNDV